MGKRVWQGALAGTLAAIVAMIVAYPFLPVLMIDFFNPHSGGKEIEQFFTLGTTFGVVWNASFGLFATVFIVIVYTSKLPFKQRILPCLFGAVLGPLWVYGADYLGESIGVWSNHQGIGVQVLMHFIFHFTWALLLSIALCSAIVVSMALKMDLIGRLFLAIGICSVAAFILKYLLAMISSLITVASLMGHMGEQVNYWQFGVPQLLGSHVAIGACAGASLAIAEIISRHAWIRLSLGPKEGYTWTVDRSMTIGSSELAEIRVPREAGIAPKHAQIQQKGNEYILTHLGSPSPTYVNNVPVQAVRLSDRDIIRVGMTDLVFHLRHSQGPPVAAPAAAPSRYSYDPIAYHIVDPMGNLYSVNQGRVTIGRDPSNGICLSWESTLSSVHAELSMLVEELTIKDLGSRNGTRVNGNLIGNTPMPLKTGDVLDLGSVRLKVQSNHPLL